MQLVIYQYMKNLFCCLYLPTIPFATLQLLPQLLVFGKQILDIIIRKIFKELF